MQIVANGTVAGLSIGLLALAFWSVYLPTRVFHIALGGVYVVSPYITWMCLRLGWPWPWAVTIALVTASLLSVACWLFNHAILERRGASPGAHLISSLGLYVVLTQAVALAWGHESKVMRTGLDTTVAFGRATLTGGQLATLLVGALLIASFYLWLRFSTLGLRFRALADNPTQLSLHGYDIRRLSLTAFGVSGILCASASLLAGYDLGFDPHSGLSAVLLAVVAGILGGRASWLGPLVGGLILGLARSWANWALSASWQDPVAYLLLAAVLVGRPNGILSRSSRPEALA